MAACPLKRMKTEITDTGIAAGPTAAAHCPLRRMNAKIWDTGVGGGDDKCAAEDELLGHSNPTEDPSEEQPEPSSKRQRLRLPETPAALYLQ